MFGGGGWAMKPQSRARCRLCGGPNPAGERFCCPDCRHRARGLVSKADDGKTWDVVRKECRPCQ